LACLDVIKIFPLLGNGFQWAYLRQMGKKVFLLDAMALVFRAYYALIRNPRLTSKGRNTNAQFGFTNTLAELINNQKPSHMAVCFDTAAPTERHTDFEEYKANRQDAPEDILAALPDIKKIIRGFNIPILEVDGYEADDVIGTLCKQAEKAGYEVFMVTPDKDYGQLVSEKIKIYKPGYHGGDVEIMGPKEVCEKWCIQTVDQVVDILGLMGDAVDNIPGIAGVGQKTACKLLTEYGTLENVLDNADKIKGALGEKIKAGKEKALLSKKLATIITNVPVEFHEEDFKLKDWNKEKLTEIFTELEFKTLIKRILGEQVSALSTAPDGVQTDLFGNAVELQKAKSRKTEEVVEEVIEEISDAVLKIDKNIHNCPHDYKAIEGDEEIKALVKELMSLSEICFDTETTGIDANDAELVGFSFSAKACEGYFIPCPADQTRTKEILAHFSVLLNDETTTWVGQNLKYDLLVLRWYGYELK